MWGGAGRVVGIGVMTKYEYLQQLIVTDLLKIEKADEFFPLHHRQGAAT